MLFDLWLGRGWYFDKAADNTPGNTTADSTGEEDGEKKEAKTSDSKSAGDDEQDPKAKVEEKKFTQADVDQIVKERLERERKKSEADAEKARKKAEEDALVKNQEFQKLAEQRAEKIMALEASVKELEPYKAQAEQYKSALQKQLSSALEKLPKAIRSLIEKMQPLEALEYLAENAKDLGVKPEAFRETPDAKAKTLTDEERSDARKAQAGLVQRSF